MKLKTLFEKLPIIRRYVKRLELLKTIRASQMRRIMELKKELDEKEKWIDALDKENTCLKNAMRRS